ncbi:DUF5060 domain-containing protein [Fimbriimonas ginsengisoli]|uniref:Uncharacterized protein n=1 Tax=Fimbriimonas ginsengisoli Gsoil 348 TaxID=661478 RepID=A0A068NLV2_FIMGI|nr:DUF5060 domain-containing protein [Fimbriimonas ginsengisoli]AIE84451.1 hypothetical protein OP10G_1083 [Fimbriimonas ginsengisoli Gsoil 348]
MLSTFAFALILAHRRDAPIHTPYAKSERLGISGASLSAPKVPRLGLEEIQVDAHGTFENPFDPEDVALDAHVIPPSGQAYDLPGFFYQPFGRELSAGKEVLSPSGSPKWLVRIAPKEVGEHRVELTFRDRTGVSKRTGIHFMATEGTQHGMIRVSPRDRRYFEYDDGSAYYPVGSNVCWGGDPGTFNYDQWFSDYGKQKANYARLWLSPFWTTFALDVPGKPEEGKGMGQFDLGNAWRLDYVLDLARQNGLNLQLCIESYNILRNTDAYPWWPKTPHNRENGGPLRIWSDFWTDPEMDRLFKTKLRYLVARYSAFSNVFSWEMWNEVDIVQDFNVDLVRDWHRRMGAELHRIDPYAHPVTTSVGNTMGIRDLELIPELDYFQTHHYGSPDLAGTVLLQQSRKAWGRPHLIGEVGADASGSREKDDPTGIQIHDPMWASVACGVSGAASPWWWDNLTAPNGLYPIFGAVARFVDGIDWPGEAFQLNDITFAYQSEPTKRQYKDLIFEGGPIDWGKSRANQPKTLTVSPSGVQGPLPLAGIQHGVVNHPDLHNPVRFKVNLPRPTRFEVIVGDVSGFGGATLKVELDGERIMTRDFADTDTSTETLTKYSGRYGFTVPAGAHTIRVENVGKDWFMASYRFVALTPRSKPPIDGWCIVGNDTVLAWFRPEGRTWQRLAVMKEKLPPVPPTMIGLAGLASGTWTVEYWDTWKGIVLSTRTVTVPRTGKVRVPLPGFDGDLAVKMRKGRR